MRLRQLTWLRLHSLTLVALALLLLPGVVIAQEVITVRLDPVGDSGVSSTATLIAAGDGTTVELEIKGLAPGADARSTMHAGTCAMPSASFAALPDLKADATGRATATGSALSRNAGRRTGHNGRRRAHYRHPGGRASRGLRGDSQADVCLGPSDPASDRWRGNLTHGCHCGCPGVVRLVCRPVPAAARSTSASFLTKDWTLANFDLYLSRAQIDADSR